MKLVYHSRDTQYTISLLHNVKQVYASWPFRLFKGKLSRVHAQPATGTEVDFHHELVVHWSPELEPLLVPRGSLPLPWHAQSNKPLWNLWNRRSTWMRFVGRPSTSNGRGAWVTGSWTGILLQELHPERLQTVPTILGNSTTSLMSERASLTNSPVDASSKFVRSRNSQRA